MDVGAVFVSPEMRAVEEEKKDENQGEASDEEKNDDEKKAAKKKWYGAWQSEDDWKFPMNWMKQCSKHLSHIETRLMESEYLSHEVVRQLMQLILGCSPPPRGDFGWLLRKCTDIGVRHLRQLVRYYLRSGQELKTFAKGAMQVVRLLFEEAWHRCLRGAKEPMMRSALCCIAVTMKDVEEDSVGTAACDFGFFWTFSEPAVMRIAEKVGRNQTTSVEDMPSWASVMSQPLLKIEVFSLMLVRVQPSSMRMSNSEIKAFYEAKREPLTEAELKELSGVEGPSVFEACFLAAKGW